MSIARELRLLQRKWKRSKARNLLKPIPDGNYKCRIIDARIEKSKSSGRLQVVQILQILRPKKYKSRMLYRYAGLETKGNLGFFKSDLKRLGIKIPKNIINISRSIENTIDLKCSVTVRTRGEFTNIFINRLIK